MKSANGVGAVIDDCVDDSTRGRLVAALTDGLRRMLAEGDGEGASVVLRALEDVAGLVQARLTTRVAGRDRLHDAAPESDHADGEVPNVMSIERARRRGSKDGKTGP